MNAIELSLFVRRLKAVAAEMGAGLRRAALSPNITDRLDFSCALFTADGELVAQAAHIPVHLGSMAYAMQQLVQRFDWAEGDMVVFNDPYLGGTHLPDVTVVAPVFFEQQLVAFCANRAHHADIGCDQPGSMPLSRTLDEEGLVIAPRYLMRNGHMLKATREFLRQHLRNAAMTLGDFAAQASANRIGLARTGELAAAMGKHEFTAALGAVNNYAERMARRSLADMANGTYRAHYQMDSAGEIATPVDLQVAIRIDGDEACVDFSGSAMQLEGNINCPVSVTAAAVYYVFYALMPPDTPPCAGAMRPIRIIAPQGSVVNATSPAAVAAGNVETSQALAELLLRALARPLAVRIPAASQGTMNNIAMGGRSGGKVWDYYETIGGGCGANPHSRGNDAMHSHMTNTLNTPIEVVEAHFPLRITAYGVRRNSGGAGLKRGGDGIVREYEFLEDTEFTLLTERRHQGPAGLNGGGDGVAGHNLLNGKGLPAKCKHRAAAGDRLRIETPGGGGWGQVISTKR